ncbi:MAG: tRNA (adenosine(37)-N6)-threonylcarbamoyltransferase complex dimerization subunit type 1 TsaB [Defluviitaleaceae bacterium]|nr:tRNA (adenosine(37)-N6)-threonylcarbamoyltransferase complex dimerization subunit type 1 TsaB [Defluviitaleaceae bacterium]
MNTILALDTSSASSSVAVLRGSKLMAEATQINPSKQHCEGLMPMLDQCLTMAGLSPQDLDGIACTSGPGSFTGIRIGAAAAKGLAHAVGIGIVAVPTLDALAYTVFNTSSIIAPIMDARRGQVYTALYNWDKTGLTRMNEYECTLLTDVFSYLDNRRQKATFTGDGVGVFLDDIISRGHDAAPDSMHHVHASSVGLLALDMLRDGYTPLRYDAFTPFYLRKPQAERELEAKCQGL